jgi:hypothetical protein
VARSWRKITGYERVSTTEQILGLQHDDLKPAFDASVDHTDARSHESSVGPPFNEAALRYDHVRRQALPEGACAGVPALRAEVERLLGQDTGGRAN